MIENAPPHFEQFLYVLVLILIIAWYLNFLRAWYVCRYKKFNFEIEKAQKLSKIFRLYILDSKHHRFEKKINYEAIRLHIIDFICNLTLPEDNDILQSVLNVQSYIDADTNLKISMISSIFSDTFGEDLSKFYFKTYPVGMAIESFNDEMNGIRALSEDELFDYNLLKYKLLLEERDFIRNKKSDTIKESNQFKLNYNASSTRILTRSMPNKIKRILLSVNGEEVELTDYKFIEVDDENNDVGILIYFENGSVISIPPKKFRVKKDKNIRIVFKHKKYQLQNLIINSQALTIILFLLMIGILIPFGHSVLLLLGIGSLWIVPNTYAYNKNGPIVFDLDLS